MNLTASPSQLTGTIPAPPSKSLSLRALGAAFLSRKKAFLRNISSCADVKNALVSLKELGLHIEHINDSTLILHPQSSVKNNILSCGESGLWLRMMAPILSLSNQPYVLKGAGSLCERPVQMLIDPLQNAGVFVDSRQGFPPIALCGPLQPGTIHLSGKETSQFLTGLLMALPLLSGPSRIIVDELNSRPYIDMTLSFLDHFGISVENQRYQEFIIRGNQQYQPVDFTVEGDWSGAAFFLVAGAFAGPVTVTGLNPDSSQGDKAILKALRLAGARVISEEGNVTVLRGNPKPFEFDAVHTPDLFPPLAVLAHFSPGISSIKGVSRLFHKESNRATALQNLFRSLGLSLIIKDDVMLVQGGIPRGGTVSSFNDHRMAMSAALLGLGGRSAVSLIGAEAVEKSYPEFFDHIRQLGGKIYE